MIENIKQIKIHIIIAILLIVSTINNNLLFSNEQTLRQTNQIINSKLALYKDINTTTPPLSYHLNWIFLTILPTNIAIVVEYLFLSILILILIHSICKDLIKSNKSLFIKTKLLHFPAFFYIILQVIIGWEDVSAMLGSSLILFAALFLFRYYDQMSNKNSTLFGIIPIGLCIGLLAVTRQDMASYMWGLFFWAMFWAGMADVEGRKLSLLKRAIKGILQGLFLTLIMICVIFIMLYYFIANCGTEVLFDQLVVVAFNAKNIQLLSPFSIQGVIFYVPIIAAIISLLVLIFNNRKKIIKTNTPLFWKEMLLINLTLNAFNYSLLGNKLSNILPATIFTSLLSYNIFSFFKNKKRGKQHCPPL